jgi:hypothetical protein
MNTSMLLISAALAVGCATPTVGYRIATVPAAGQSPAHLAADADACEQVARPGQPGRERTYTACMIVRGYTTYVRLHGIPLEVTQTRAHEMGNVDRDLTACSEAGEEAGRWDRLTTAQKVGVAIGYGGGLLGAAGASLRVEAMEAAMAACLQERGYTLQRWVPAGR